MFGFLKRKKAQITGQLAGLVGVVIVVVIAAIVAIFGFDVLDTVDNGFAANSYGANASALAQQGIGNITAKFPLLGTIVVIGLVLAALTGFLVLRNR